MVDEFKKPDDNKDSSFDAEENKDQVSELKNLQDATTVKHKFSKDMEGISGGAAAADSIKNPNVADFTSTINLAKTSSQNVVPSKLLNQKSNVS